MKKRILALITALAIIAILPGCNSNNNAPANTPAAEADTSADEPAGEEEVVDEVTVEYMDPLALEGEYMDSVSGRASMVVYYNSDDNVFNIAVSWANSAMEDMVWYMNARDDGQSRLVYEDCENDTITYKSETEADTVVNYEGGKGYFTFDNGRLLWDGAADDNCKECSFERME